MAQFSYRPTQINVSPPLQQDRRIDTEATPFPLLHLGLNMGVIISAASMTIPQGQEAPQKSVLVMAHLDTGASRTSIDIELANMLELPALGAAKTFTAAGAVDLAEYAINIAFPLTGLRPFRDLRVGSCRLPFDPDQTKNSYMSPKNFGVLIGRDIMANWNIVWNGPTSTVFISD